MKHNQIMESVRETGVVCTEYIDLAVRLSKFNEDLTATGLFQSEHPLSKHIISLITYIDKNSNASSQINNSR